MVRVEPVPGEPAATADFGAETGLVVADYHAGIEAGLRYERGVELESAADERLARLESLVDRTDPDRLLFLGDLAHRIAAPEGPERDELDALFDAVDARGLSVTLVRGNHDGGVADAYGDRIDVTDAAGVRLGDVGFAHGHTWPSADVLSADVVCVGHEHPVVRLQDSVGGSRVERAWLRGPLRRETFEPHVDGELDWAEPELVVFPAFNDRSGGTWVNVDGQSFLSPFLPDGVDGAEAYLLDGTRLGHYRRL